MATINPNTLLDFAKTIVSGDKGSGGARLATVTRVDENGVAYVQLPGGEETPIATTGATYNIGDVISVTMFNGKLRATGNMSEPSVSGRAVNAAFKPVQKAAELAKAVANEAAAVAAAINQHFWSDTNGAHVTDVTQDEWKTAADNNFSDVSDLKPYNNLLMNSLGILLRSALNNLVSITRSAIAFYDGLGNSAANIIARFGKDGAQVGYADESHLELDYHSMALVDKEGNPYFAVVDMREADGYAAIVNVFHGDGSTVVFPISPDCSDYSTMSVTVSDSSGGEVTVGRNFIEFETAPADDALITATYKSDDVLAKYYTIGIRADNSTNGAMSVAEGNAVEASGLASHAEGNETVASGRMAHAEGNGSVASGSASHAEGSSTVASFLYSHAEGQGSEASNWSAHAEGSYTLASGAQSHAQNYYTIAASENQTALGKFNVSDANGAYAVIVGNGTSSSARSNALMVDWNGDIYPRATKMADFIVEQGTSSIWTYRKWNSGISECWGTYSDDIAVNSASAAYGGYRSSNITATAYPTNLFNEIPVVTMTAADSQGYHVVTASGSTKTNAKFYLGCGASLSTAVRGVYIHAVGTWK